MFKNLARFLKGVPVISVWSQLPGQKSWTLVVSTDLELTPEHIVKLFCKRWKTEPMFNEIKHFFGVSKAWQRSSRSLHCWFSMLSLIMNTNKEQKGLAADCLEEILLSHSWADPE